MKLKKKSMAVLLAALAFSVLVSGCGKAKIGYFNAERVKNESPQIEAVLQEGNAKIADLQKESAELMQKRESMSQEDFQKAQSDMQMKATALQQQYSSELKQKMDAALEQITKDKKLDVVMENEPSGPSVIQGGEDITDDVIQKLQ